MKGEGCVCQSWLGSPCPGDGDVGMLTRLAAVTSLHASPCGATKKCSCSLLTRSCVTEEPVSV